MLFLNRSVSVLALGMVLVSGSIAHAQSVPSSVEPGRVRADIEDTFKQGQKIDSEVTTAPMVQAPAGANKITFVLKSLNVQGNTKLADADLKAVYAGDINKKISLTRVYEIANQITQLYRAQGYILSRAVVPAQEIGKGTVTLQVIEGFVSNYTIQGDVPPAVKAKLDMYAQRLVGQGTVSAGNLERYLLLMNDLSGVKIRSILSPSTTVAGGANLTLVAEQKKTEFLVGMDNWGNSYLGHERFTGGVQINSPFGLADQINATALLAPDHDEVEYYGLGYQHYVGDEGTRVGVSGSYTKTKPSLPLNLGGNLGPEGTSTNLTFSAAHPFVRSRAFNLFGRLSFDVSQNKTDYDPGFSAIETQDDLRVLRMGGSLTYLDGLAGYNQLDLGLSQGLEILGSSKTGDAKLSRAAGQADFTKLNVEASRLQRIVGPFNVLVGLNSQYTHQALMASEEIGFGGSDYGRGYDFSEITGDRGVAGKIEFSYNKPTDYQYLDNYQVYSFYDAGAVWNQDPGVGLASRQSLASTGVGVRLNINSNVRADTFVAKPLTRDIPSRGDDSRDLRWKFSVTSNF